MQLRVRAVLKDWFDRHARPGRTAGQTADRLLALLPLPTPLGYEDIYPDSKSRCKKAGAKQPTMHKVYISTDTDKRIKASFGGGQQFNLAALHFLRDTSCHANCASCAAWRAALP